MNDPHDNALDDQAALEKYVPEAAEVRVHKPGDYPPDRYDPVTGEVFDDDAPASGWDKERHCPTNLGGANWAGEKLRLIEEALAFNAKAADAEIAAIGAEAERKAAAVRERLKKANAPFVPGRDYFRTALALFATGYRAELLKGMPRDRTKRPLPCGVVVGFKERRSGYFWDDSMPEAERKAALLRWALIQEREGKVDLRAGPLAIPPPGKVPNVPRIKEFLEAIVRENKEPREVPPGFRYVEPGEELVVETGIKQEEES